MLEFFCEFWTILVSSLIYCSKSSIIVEQIEGDKHIADSMFKIFVDFFSSYFIECKACRKMFRIKVTCRLYEVYIPSQPFCTESRLWEFKKEENELYEIQLKSVEWSRRWSLPSARQFPLQTNFSVVMERKHELANFLGITIRVPRVICATRRTPSSNDMFEVSVSDIKWGGRNKY